ncbi:MAG: AraC family transcriptional regulator [Lachnospiraceae bacterium]|nr:AraC family transcriptional regulator [Lachnospiraceae bacterium]
MDERQLIEGAFHSSSVVGEGLTAGLLLSAFYSYEKVSEPLKEAAPLHVCAGGFGTITAPVRFSFDQLPMCLILYTEAGGVRMRRGEESLVLSEGEFCAISMGEGTIEMNPTIFPWSYRIYIIAGRDLDLYLPYMKEMAKSVNVKPGAVFSAALQQAGDEPGDAEYLNIHQNLTFLLTEAVLPSLDPLKRTHALPDYLVKMHEFVLQPNGQSFSLKYFENDFHISRYRLCREYSKAFGVSPLKDFNNTRMHEARNLLVSTDEQVQEIANQVGFENVTHFINLFKQVYNMTPGEFRRMSRGQ